MSKLTKYQVMQGFIGLLLLFSLITCTNSQEDVAAEVDSSTSTSSASYTLSAEQIASQNIEFIPFEKVSQNNFVLASGLIDLPPENRLTISVVTDGFVKEVRLIAGDKVTKGQSLFKIMNPDFLELQRALVEAKNSLELASKEWVRVQSFKEDNIVSTKQFDEAKAAYNNAKASYSAQKKHLALIGFDVAQIEQGEFTSEVAFKSPVNGVISMVEVTTGSFVQRSAKVMEVLDVDHFHVELSIFEAEAALVKEGQALWVRKVADTNNNQLDWAKGYVFRVNPSFHESERSLNVHAHVEEWSNPIVGSYVEAKIQTDSSMVWMFPKAAMTPKSNGFELSLAQQSNGDSWAVKRVFFGQKPIPIEGNPDFMGIKELDQQYVNSRLVLQN
jgi:cobalt-zinc-cadmium efflux system membrane fusion protein